MVPNHCGAKIGEDVPFAPHGWDTSYRFYVQHKRTCFVVTFPAKIEYKNNNIISTRPISIGKVLIKWQLLKLRCSTLVEHFLVSHIYIMYKKGSIEDSGTAINRNSVSQPLYHCGAKWKENVTIAPHGWDIITIFHKIRNYLKVVLHIWNQNSIHCRRCLGQNHS